MKNVTVGGLLKKYRIRPNKKWGQNFLVDKNLMDKLIDAMELYPDEDVLEIGSGLGLLSCKIAENAFKVLGIEKDRRLVKIAREEFSSQSNLKFIEADFLTVNLSELLKSHRVPVKIIGNIPYNISSRILFKLLEHSSLLDLAVLTLQKEVATRMIARPGSKDYGILTILLNSQVNCEALFDLEPGCFLPPPQVVSTAVKMTFPKTPPYRIQDPELFKKMVKTAFNQRRKTIQNTLKKLLKNNRIKPWEACHIDPNSRPEQISIESYVALANYLVPLI